MHNESKSVNQNVEEINTAIEDLNYERVEQMLSDPGFAVNFSLKKVKLLLETMFAKSDSRMAGLFLNCSRVDWLAPNWNRNITALEEKFGIQ